VNVLKGGDGLGYKVKRGSIPTDNTIKDMLLNFIRRLAVAIIILALIVAIGYFLFQFAYDKFPAFAVAADDVIGFVRGFYEEHGLWATLGLIVFVCIAVWAFGEEEKKKERRKEVMKEMMK
jgi:predicted membrane protein